MTLIPLGQCATQGHAIVYLVQAGCSWPKLSAALFGISRATTHRGFTEWTNAGLWERLHQAFLHRLGVIGEIDCRGRWGIRNRTQPG